MKPFLMKSRAVMLLFLAGMIVCLMTACHWRKTEPTLADIGVERGFRLPGAENFKISKDLTRQAGKKEFRSLEAVNGSRLLKVEIMTGFTPAEAKTVQVERMNIIHSLFSNLPSPYPGMVTNKVMVDDTLRPQLRMISVAGQELPLYILKSSSRYTYGAVPTDMVSFLGGLFFIYDQNHQTLYRFDYFIPKGEFHVEEFVHFFSGMKFDGSQQHGQFSKNAPDSNSVTGGALVPVQTDDQTAQQTPLKFKGYNLILIAFEPLGANHVSSYGYKLQTTPNLDAFAKDAILFENAVSPASWSLPAFMSWFTSMYPSQHKVTNEYSKYSKTEQVLAKLQELSPHAVTLPQVLQQNGYRTAGFTGGASLSGDFGFAAGFETYYDEKRFGGFDLLMPKALSWLKEKRQRPFFLFIEGYDVHGLFPLNRQYLPKFLGKKYHGTLTGSKEEYWALRNKSLNEGKISISGENLRFLTAVYDAKIFAADQRFGAFIKQLKKLGLFEKSIIVVSAGSGNEYMEHGRIDHGFSLYEELVHVPLIIRIPKRHGRVSQLVRTIDIMPTVLDLLDIKSNQSLDEQMQGVSLVPAISGVKMGLAGISETDYLLHVFKRSIKTNDGWKFIISLDTDKRELYNLKVDPGEGNNIVSKNGRRAYELEQQLFKTLRAKTTDE